ncbi:bcs1 atpase [Pyrenophora tritici-repentis]|nr:bcs1 atpase [Pyrenophora tritici-repentis]
MAIKEDLEGMLPPGLADAALNIPGLGAVLQLFLNKLGFDVGSTMSLYLLLFGLWQGAQYMYGLGHGYLLDHGTAAIRINDDDDLYAHFISWISAQRMTAISRDLVASSRKPKARSDDSDDGDSDEEDDDEALGESGIFNYDKWTGTNPVYYEPNLGDDSFTHDGHYFQFKKDSQENKYAERIDYFIVIRCMGRSTQPIKNLIAHVKEWSANRTKTVTNIHRADARHGGYWECQAQRPSRPISTVTLDISQKERIIADINEYLHPATARWYAARGIPHRRGYLFHGPPGTGKTSLSFALAGVFGLRVYCASLSERNMGESDLASLFSMLPSRCIVLLEDIDSAGIQRDKGEDKSDKKADDMIKIEKNKSFRRKLTQSLRTRKTPKTDSETTTLVSTKDEIPASPTTQQQQPQQTPSIQTKTSTPSPPPEPPSEDTKSKISLAGLLNIIDGAASNEGRVLIMTTNYPEKLDSALIRPGRVDLQIKFTLATREQMQEIFRRMYSNDADVVMKPKNTNKTPTAAGVKKKKQQHASKAGVAGGITVPLRPSFVTLDPKRLNAMAKQFAESLPEDTFSPAEIQGYLLMRKTDPEGALSGVQEWKEALMEAKKKGKKVVEIK